MNKKLIIFLGICFVLVAHARADDAETIIQDVMKANEGYHDEKMRALMTIQDGERKVSREMIIARWEGGKTGPSKSLVRILAPADLMNTALLSINHGDGVSDQWLYLPAAGKTKRIIGGSRSGSFAGSHFSYDDILPFDEKKYSYAFLRRESFSGVTCAVLQATPKNQKDGGEMKTVWIDTTRHLIMQVVTNTNNAGKSKTLTFDKFVQKGGYWRPQKLVMTVTETDHTIIELAEIMLPAQMKAEDFSERALVR